VGNWKVTRLSEGDLREREREREIHGKVRDGRIYLYSTKTNLKNKFTPIKYKIKEKKTYIFIVESIY
jgi:hypothetical protein